MGPTSIALDADDLDWLASESQRLGISKSELARRALKHFRHNVEPAPDPTPPTQPHTQEIPVPRPKHGDFNKQPVAPKSKVKYDATNPMPTELRLQPARTTCPRCGATVNELDGAPAYHLRASRPGDDNYSIEVPTMSPCIEASDE